LIYFFCPIEIKTPNNLNFDIMKIFSFYKIYFLILFNFFIDPSVVLAEGLRDVKPPIPLPFPFFLVILMIAILLIVMVIFLFWFRLKKKNTKKSIPSQVIIPPWQKAFKLLAELQKERLLQEGKVKEYYLKLSNILRNYIEEKFDIKAPEMTTEEFLFSLKNFSDFTGKQKNMLKDFLTCCDMVKFAKHMPEIVHAKESLEIIKSFITETKKEITHNVEPAQ